jgi:predicted RNA polymerase sigma factor
MEFMLVLYEDPDLIATDEQRKEAVERVGEYAMSLIGDGTLKGGAPLHPVTEAKKVRTRDGAWLMTVCRDRARNLVRDDGRAQQRLASLRPLLDDAAHPGGETPEIADDRLRLIAMCCHPLLAADAQVALTLRMVAGLTTQEIGRGFSVPAAAIAQRIVRAKRSLREHQVAFATDDPDIRGRLGSVLDVIYLIFNEGYLPAEAESLTRGDLASEARRLACLLTSLMPAEPDPWALRSLLSFQLSRWSTRTGPDGALLTLDAQDRSRWDRELIADGMAALGRARGGACGPLLLQAELAACHATAPSFAASRPDRPCSGLRARGCVLTMGQGGVDRGHAPSTVRKIKIGDHGRAAVLRPQRCAAGTF